MNRHKRKDKFQGTDRAFRIRREDSGVLLYESNQKNFNAQSLVLFLVHQIHKIEQKFAHLQQMWAQWVVVVFLLVICPLSTCPGSSISSYDTK